MQYSYSPLKDSKFLTGLADFVFSAALFFGGQFGTETVQQIVNFLVIGIQPLVGILIMGMIQAENALIRKNLLPRHLRER